MQYYPPIIPDGTLCLIHEDSMRRVFDDEVQALQKRAAHFGVEIIVKPVS